MKPLTASGRERMRVMAGVQQRERREHGQLQAGGQHREREHRSGGFRRRHAHAWL